jgi:hypothetical protein
VLFGSEVPEYETTYLAGNTAEISLLVTFSVHKRYRAVRSEVLQSMMESIRFYQRAY